MNQEKLLQQAQEIISWLFENRSRMPQCSNENCSICQDINNTKRKAEKWLKDCNQKGE